MIVLSVNSLHLEATIAPAFYDAPSPERRAAWLAWLRRWRSLDGGGTEEARAEAMRQLNPKYIPRDAQTWQSKSLSLRLKVTMPLDGHCN